MERMREQVKEHNVYRWAADLLTDLCAVDVEAAAPASTEELAYRRPA